MLVVIPRLLCSLFSCLAGRRLLNTAFDAPTAVVALNLPRTRSLPVRMLRSIQTITKFL